MWEIKTPIILFMAFCSVCYSEIQVEKTAFKLWRQVQNTTQQNHITLRFKTIHATGLIMFARGASKEDFLSIELYRGKIRVSGNYANGTLNALRPIDGQYDMYAGKDLADNQWHTVEFIRNIRQSIIYIDRGTSMERMSFSKSPPTYTDLSVSMVTFGGYFSFAPSEISSRVSLSRRGIYACFSEAKFTQQWWPEVERGWRPQPFVIDFLSPATTQFKMQGMTTYGTIKDFCEESVPPYKPLFFSSSAVHLALVQNYSIPSLKIELKFRTVINDQTLANYTTIKTGEQITLLISRKGRVVIMLDQGKTSQIIETSREDFHDGQWHTVSVYLPNVLTDDYYTAEFTVDGKTRFAKLGRNIKFNGYINIGFGFTGCMRDIKINDQDLHKVRRHPEVPNDFFQVLDVGVVYNACSLKDYCNPNPCQNGGRCNQTDDNIACNCRGTLYEGSTCHRPRFNYTCAGVRKSGERRSDVYYIDMDGMGPMRPVRALCELGKTVGTTVTQINNTKFEDVDVTTPSGINNVDINYQASITQMRELVMNSDHCQQFIKYTCKGTPLFQSPEGPPKASWMGGDDIVHFYWGGAQGRRGYCACGVNGDCQVSKVPIAQYCNCDSLNKWAQIFDEGNFSIKAHLPVRQVQFKSVLKDGSIEAALRVGHLRCSGFGSHDIAATFRKPYSYMSVYHPDQPLDNVQAGGISFDFKTSQAFNYMTMAHAIGSFSGNYVKIMIWSKTMVRVHLNLGFGDLKQDVDIGRTGRTLDDNEWHELNVMFNMKELNVTLDGIHMIQGLPLQEYPVLFSVDATPVYIGGSYYDIHGFVGCIRSLYVNGRIFDVKTIASGQEDFGVYPGCGSACPLLNRPCNYGDCYDQYDSFKCNCSVSPYGGEFCQNETHPKSFGGASSIIYDLQKANLSEPLASGILAIGFKTNQERVTLAQIVGIKDRHFTLALIDGYLTLYWSLKDKENLPQGSLEEKRIEQLQINKRKLNTDRHQVVKLIISAQEIWLHIPNYNLYEGVNVTETNVFNRDKSAILRVEPDGLVPAIVRIGTAENIKFGDIQLPSGFTGCMSGAKFVFTPHATTEDSFPDAIEIDFFELISENNDKDRTSNNPSQNEALSGSFPSPTDRCGPNLKIPGKLPTVGPARQFFTRSPGLDLSVRIPETDWVNQLMIVVVILIVAVVILGILFVAYKKVNKSMIEYNQMRKEEHPKKRKDVQSTKYTASKAMGITSTAPVETKEKPLDMNTGATEMQSFDSPEENQGMFF